jgi:hypothetical protein
MQVGDDGLSAEAGMLQSKPFRLKIDPNAVRSAPTYLAVSQVLRGEFFGLQAYLLFTM